MFKMGREATLVPGRYYRPSRLTPSQTEHMAASPIVFMDGRGRLSIPREEGDPFDAVKAEVDAGAAAHVSDPADRFPPFGLIRDGDTYVIATPSAEIIGMFADIGDALRRGINQLGVFHFTPLSEIPQ